MLWNSGFKRSSGCYVSNFCSTSEAEWFLSLFCAQRFTGHSTAVTTLRFATTRPPDSNGLYFLSGAAHDRLLSVWWVSPLELFLMWCHGWARLFFSTHAFMKPTWHWLCRQVREDGKDKNSVVSFTLTDEPRHIDLVTSNSKEEVRVGKCLWVLRL